MNNVVDSCGWLEYFANGHNAEFFSTAIEDTKNLLVPAICVYEVFKRVYQQCSEDAALQAVSLMNVGRIINIDDTVALCAAKYSIERNLPMADSIILATAHIYKAVVWTQDSDFKNIPGVKYIHKK